ncbi:MAG: efflux RND transporter periplasmic adaptor subunit [Myxococcota bacterium]
MIGFVWFLACGEVDPATAEGDVTRALRPGEIALGETALRNAGLRVDAVQPVSLSGQLAVPARLTLDPRQEARVAAVAAGTVEQIEVRPGDVVNRGARLATVLSPDLDEAIGAHLSAVAKLETARAKRDRTAALRRDGFASPSQELDAEADLTVAAAEAEAAEERVRVFGIAPEAMKTGDGQHFSSRFAVRSPLDGLVLGIDAALGASVDSGDALFHVGNLDELWLLVGVYEKSLASIVVGAPVTFTVDAYGEELFSGTVDAVGDWLDPASRTAEVRVIVPNPDHRLKPNMFARARLSVGGASGDGLVVPSPSAATRRYRPSASGGAASVAVPVIARSVTDLLRPRAGRSRPGRPAAARSAWFGVVGLRSRREPRREPRGPSPRARAADE